MSIKNGGYVFLIRSDSVLSMSLWKEFQLLQILNNLSSRHLIKLILYGNGEEDLYRWICDMFGVWHFDYWYLKWIHQEKRWNGIWWKSAKAMEYEKFYPSGSVSPKM